MIPSHTNPSLIGPAAHDARPSLLGGAPLDSMALRVARLQMQGVFIFPYAPGRWRVVRLDNNLPRIVGSGASQLEALDEAEDVARAL